MAAIVQVDRRTTDMMDACLDHGMPTDQLKLFVKAGYVLAEQMMDFHAAAREADLEDGPDEIALGGTRDAAKSFTAMQQVGNDDCQRFPGLKVLFLRKVMKSAAESLDDMTRKVFQYTPHKITANGVQFPNGSRILIGGYKDQRDIDKYLGIEYDAIVQEESTQLTEEKNDKVRGSMRTSIRGFRCRRYHTTNADGIGLSWFKKKFVIPWRMHTETTTRFFDVSYKGNPWADPNYVTWLEGLKGPLYKAWALGDWDAFAGMAFPQWSYERHVIKVADTFDIPNSWVKWTATDGGYAAPFCTLWLAKHPDSKRVYVYREAYSAGLTDRAQARMILDLTLQGEDVKLHFADPALWQQKNKDNIVYTTADEYRKEGVILTKGDNNRLGGVRKTHTLLADLPDGKPGVQFFETCPHIIEQMGTLALDAYKVEDVDTDQEDHAYDAWRYGITNERKLVASGPLKDSERNPLDRYKDVL